MSGLSPRRLRIDTERFQMRPPKLSDFQAWVHLRTLSADFLTPWEPKWSPDHLTQRGFTNRYHWAQSAIRDGTSVPLFLIRRSDQELLGSITLENIRRGPAQMSSLGYWIGEPFTRQGYISEAIAAVVHFAFTELKLSRLEAACLKDNVGSRRALEKNGFKYEGVAQSYLEINGRWRTHVLYATLRSDRRGRAD